MIFSAGSPLKADIYEFIRNDIKDVFISNGTGGTDICSVFLGSCPVLPMYQGVIQCPFLGVALACFDENGNPYTQGEEGDLVITQPFPNAPLGLLGDDENKTKLKDTYYNQYPGRTAWYQADYRKFKSFM
jgi:acetoacetyl-CoA synthetase